MIFSQVPFAPWFVNFSLLNLFVKILDTLCLLCCDWEWAGGDNLQFLPEGVRRESGGRECRIRLKYRPLFSLMALPLPTTGCWGCRGRRETNWMLKNDPHPDKSFGERVLGSWYRMFRQSLFVYCSPVAGVWHIQGDSVTNVMRWAEAWSDLGPSLDDLYGSAQHFSLLLFKTLSFKVRNIS